MESTEYLVHILRSDLDNLRSRMRAEQSRVANDVHWHQERPLSCDQPGCAGPDPVKVTLRVLMDEVVSISQEFPKHSL